MIQTPMLLLVATFLTQISKFGRQILRRGRDKKVDARNQKGGTKYIFYQIFSPSDTQKDSKFVFE